MSSLVHSREERMTDRSPVDPLLFDEINKLHDENDHWVRVVEQLMRQLQETKTESLAAARAKEELERQLKETKTESLADAAQEKDEMARAKNELARAKNELARAKDELESQLLLEKNGEDLPAALTKNEQSQAQVVMGRTKTADMPAQAQAPGQELEMFLSNNIPIALDPQVQPEGNQSRLVEEFLQSPRKARLLLRAIDTYASSNYSDALETLMTEMQEMFRLIGFTIDWNSVLPYDSATSTSIVKLVNASSNEAFLVYREDRTLFVEQWKSEWDKLSDS